MIYESGIDLYWISFALTISIAVSFFFGKLLELRSSLVAIIFAEHFAMLFVYINFVSIYGGDLIGYWNNSIEFEYDFTPGTKFITSLVKVVSFFVGYDFWATNIVFMTFGVLAVELLAKILLDLNNSHVYKNNFTIAAMILFPSLHYWSSSIGKDGLALLSITLYIYAISHQKYKRLLFIVLSLVIMLFTRVYVVAIMILLLGLCELSSNNSVKIKLFIFVMLLLSAIFAMIAIPQYYELGEKYNVENIDFIAIQNLFSERENYNTDGVSSYAISNLSIIERMLSYMYRPFFVDAPGIYGLLASLENIFLVSLSVRSLLNIRTYFLNPKNLVFWNLIFLFIVLLLMLSYTTANMGIAMRQKTMILPCFMYICLFGLRETIKKN